MNMKLADKLAEMGVNQSACDRATGAPRGSTHRWVHGLEHNMPSPRVMTAMMSFLCVDEPWELGFDGERLWVCTGYANSARECGDSSRLE
jgi:hypothetical protein